MLRRLPAWLLCALLGCLLPLSMVTGQSPAGTEIAAANSGKFDAPLEFILAQVTQQGAVRAEAAAVRQQLALLSGRFHFDLSAEVPLIHLLLQIQSEDDAELRRAGVPILCRVGDVIATALPVDRVAELRTLGSVVKVEACKALQPEIDVSMVATRANLLRTALPGGTFAGQTGSGALIAIMDTGIDINHQDFRNPDGSTRIKALWDVADRSFRATSGVIGTVPPMSTPTGQPLGTVYTEAQINAALRGAGVVNSRSLEGHGHHVAGIAAGNGRATGGGQVARQYVGMAPQAGLIVVQVFPNDQDSYSVAFDDTVLGALAFIDQKAGQFGLPVAVNMSFGTHVGAHDGTSLMERAIDSFSGPGKRGRVVVKSAGNDGSRDIHAGGQFGPPGALNNIIEVEVTKTGTGNIELDFWFAGSDTFNITFDGGGLGLTPVTGLIRTDPVNGDKELYVETSRSGTFRVRIEGQTVLSGRFDAWIPSRNAGFTSYQERLRRVTIPGTSRSVITVGAFNTKNSWVDIDGVSRADSFLEIGKIADFSSDGPTRDGRQKPDLTAPGQRIASSLAGTFASGSSLNLSIFSRQDVAQDTVHALSQGTSFAAPHVTGLAALMLSRNPDLDARQIRDIMTATAYRDSFTGASPEAPVKPEILPDIRWGYGKLDAKAAYDATPDPVATRFLGFIDYPSVNASLPRSFSVVGWALASHGVASVDIIVDGISTIRATYGQNRPDVCLIFPSFGPGCPGVGFTAQVPGLDFGMHTLSLRITDRFGNRSEGSVSPRVIQINPFSIRAVIDVPAADSRVSPNFDLYGWAVSDAGIRQVEILIDGIFVKNAILRQVRPDVCTAFPGADPDCPRVGFRAILSGLAPGTHQLAARITDNNGAVRSIVESIQVSPPRIRYNLETPGSGAFLGSSFNLSGWAASPVGIASVEIYVDDSLRSLASLSLPRADVCAAYPGLDPDCPAVGFSGSVSDIGLGQHTITLLIRDRQGEIALLSTPITVVIQSYVELPAAGSVLVGPVDIAGWVVSPAGIAEVAVLVDGGFVWVATIGLPRPDVCAVFPLSDPNCPNVGFRARVTIPSGRYSLQLRISNRDGRQILQPLPPIGITVAGSGLEQNSGRRPAAIPLDDPHLPGSWWASRPGRDAVFVAPY